MRRTAIAISITVAGLLLVATATQAGQGSPGDVTLTPEAYLPIILNNHPPLVTPTPPPDWCEPNNLPAQACAIERGTHQARVSSAYDQDWYAFTLSGSASVRIVLDGPAGDDYDLYLYRDPGGSSVGHSVTPGSADEALEISLEPGTYYVLVFPIQAAGNLPYWLTLEF